MVDFDFQNATRLIFGKDVEKGIGVEVAKLGKHALFVHYGDGLIEKLGLHDTVKNSLEAAGVKVSEMSGIRPSPVLSKAHEGIKYARENGVDVVIAVGGGSVMDTAKVVAAGVPYDGDVWDFFVGKAGPLEQALPLVVVVTYPGTGSETSTGTVITNEAANNHKTWMDSVLLRPRIAFMNPELTYSLPPYLTACGVADMLSHAMEHYMSNDIADLSDRLCEGYMRSVRYTGINVMKNPNDYQARAETMYAGMFGHNGILSVGKRCGWESHTLGHELTTFFHVAHGATLAIMFPAWMKYVYKANKGRFMQYAIRVFDVDASFADEDGIILEGIKRLEEFFKSLGLPTRMSEVKEIDLSKIPEMADKVVIKGNLNGITELTREDVIKIYELAK